MRTVMAYCAVGAFALALAACATEKPASAPVTSGSERVFDLSDSLDIAAYEDIFAEEHARLLKEIQSRQETGTPDTDILEAVALVSASEEMYLRGRLDIAMKLLDEAARTLKPKR